jgi:hypothetical protein
LLSVSFFLLQLDYVIHAFQRMRIGCWRADYAKDSNGLLFVDRMVQNFLGFPAQCVPLVYLITQVTHPLDMGQIRAAFDHAKDPKGDGLYFLQHRFPLFYSFLFLLSVYACVSVLLFSVSFSFAVPIFSDS